MSDGHPLNSLIFIGGYLVQTYEFGAITSTEYYVEYDDAHNDAQDASKFNEDVVYQVVSVESGKTVCAFRNGEYYINPNGKGV